MPNGEEDHEGEASGGDSADWKSDDGDDEETDTTKNTLP